MDVIRAEKIGSRQAIKCVTVGLIIAQLIMTLLTSGDGFVNGFFWLLDENDFKLNILIGVICMYLCGHFYGRRAGYEIIIRKRNNFLVGFIAGLLIIVTATFLTSWVGFFQEGVDNIGSNDNPFSDYILTPVFCVTIFGLIPCLFVGLWFGYSIKKRGDLTET
jgi:ribose/xylose/arabinose/galactoside ABC-type transport system permease subunit